MRKTNKWGKAVLQLLCIACLSLALVACGGGELFANAACDRYAYAYSKSARVGYEFGRRSYFACRA